MRQRDIKAILNLVILPYVLFWNLLVISTRVISHIVGPIYRMIKLRLMNSGIKYQPLRKGQNGWVYVLSNPTLEVGIHKIGMTTRYNYQERVDELNSATSIPTNFKVEHVHPCSDPYQLEQILHKKFTSQRVNAKREFFRVTVKEIKDQISKLDRSNDNVGL